MQSQRILAIETSEELKAQKQIADNIYTKTQLLTKLRSLDDEHAQDFVVNPFLKDFYDGESLLDIVLASENVPSIKAFLNKRANIFELIQQSKYALLRVIGLNEQDITDAFIEHVPLKKINQVVIENDEAETALDLAVKLNQLQTVKLLLKKGANPHQIFLHQPSDFSTIYQKANTISGKPHYSLITDMTYFDSPVMQALKNNSSEILTELLKKEGAYNGINHLVVNAEYRKVHKDVFCGTLVSTYSWRMQTGYLHAAMMQNSAAMVNQCLQLGADPNLYRNCLHKAANPKVGIEVTKLLLEKTTNIDAKDNHGRTALHLFAAKASNEKFSELLKKHPNLNAKDNDKLRPLDYAMRDENPIFKVKELLLQGAEPLFIERINTVQQLKAKNLILAYNCLYKLNKTHPAFSALQSLNQKCSQNPDIYFEMLRVFAKTEDLLHRYWSNNVNRSNGKVNIIRALNETYTYLNSTQDNEEAITQHLKTFISNLKQVKEDAEKDHNKNGTLSFFGTKSRLAEGLKETLKEVHALIPEQPVQQLRP